MLKDFTLIITKSIRHRPVRSWLTILGIIIGIMLVVIILSLGNGIKNAVVNTLQKFGSDLVIIYPGKETNPISGLFGGSKFKESDIINLKKIQGVNYVVPVDVASVNIDFKGEKKSVMSHGAPLNDLARIFKEAMGIEPTEGAWPNQGSDNKIVVGHMTAEKLFKRKLHAGDEVIVKTKPMRVAAVLPSTGNNEDDNSIYMSLNSLHLLTGSSAKAISAMARILPGHNVDLVAAQIRFELKKQDSVRDFSVITPGKAIDLVGSILSMLEFFLMTIAFVSLLVGAIGIMNTMYTSVLERTKQIGILKAIGASNDSILTMFLIESGLIGAIGGILGILFGITTSALIGLLASKYGVGNIFSFASIDYLGLSAILVLTFIVGIISGYLPARQASKMEPAQALRYE